MRIDEIGQQDGEGGQRGGDEQPSPTVYGAADGFERLDRRRLRAKLVAARFPPLLEFIRVGENGGALIVQQAMDRQAFLLFPSLYGTATSVEEFGDVLPRIEAFSPGPRPFIQGDHQILTVKSQAITCSIDRLSFGNPSARIEARMSLKSASLRTRTAMI